MSNIEGEVVVNQELFKKLAVLPQAMHSAIAREMQKVVKEHEKITKEKLSGKVLKVNTGRLRSSIGSSVSGSGTETIGKFGVMITGKLGSPLKYAAIHEFGGQIPERRPIHAKALVIPTRGGVYMGGAKQWGARVRVGKGSRPGVAGGDFIFRTRAKAFKMPARPYIRSTAKDLRPWTIKQFESMIEKLVKETNA